MLKNDHVDGVLQASYLSSLSVGYNLLLGHSHGLLLQILLLNMTKASIHPALNHKQP